MITLRNVTLRRGPNVLLDNISWTIYARQRIGIIGENGCGKSTLFSVLLGKYHADVGDVEFPRQLRLAHVAQETQAESKSALEYVKDGDVELRQLEEKLIKAEEADDGMAIAEIHTELGAIDAYTANTRAAVLLAGLGFNHIEQQKSVNEFSGGWRVRLNLAKALMTRSDMLLLDEPTNHLDLDAVIWLEQWLEEYKGTLLIISHDRDFLDSTVDHICHIAHQKLKVYTGNYSTFETQRASDLLLQQAVYDKQQKHLAHMQSFVERFRYKASKAKQAQSRLKAIERMELVCAVQSESAFHFEFKTPGSCPHPLLTVDQAQIAYGDHIVLKNIDLSIAPKERIGILGPNGAGKTSFIKMLAKELMPTEGEYTTNSGVKVGYFAQHQVEKLHLNESALAHMRRIAGNTSDQDLRKYLGGFAFSGDKVTEAVGTFSGGEKSRLSLAMIVYQKPNLLLLDEPTNHLDLEMRNALSIALQEYEGAMLLVSHDRFLLRSTTDSLYLIANQKLEAFDGDLNDYQKWLFEFRKQQTSPTMATAVESSKKEKRQEAAKSRLSRQPLSQKIERLEKELANYQRDLAEVERTLTDQSLYSIEHKEKLQKHLTTLGKLKLKVEETEHEWLEACEQRDSSE